jgi:hypothetical protein
VYSDRSFLSFVSDASLYCTCTLIPGTSSSLQASLSLIRGSSSLVRKNRRHRKSHSSFSRGIRRQVEVEVGFGFQNRLRGSGF